MKQRFISAGMLGACLGIGLFLFLSKRINGSIFLFAPDRIAIIQQAVIKKVPSVVAAGSLTVGITALVIVLAALIELEMRKKDQSPATLISHLVFASIGLVAVQIVLNVVASVILRQHIPLNGFGIAAMPIAVLSLYAPIRIWFWRRPVSGQESLNRGIKVIFDAARSAQLLKRKAVSMGADGLAIHDEVILPIGQETKHTLLIAAPGGGKTQVIYPLIERIRTRGDAMLLYDFKGDFTAAFGEDSGVVILSPFDARGYGWDIAADVTTDIKAMEFAAYLIPDLDSKEPFFKKAAQDLLTGVITKLIREKPGSWAIGDLAGILTNKSDIIASCEQYRPGALSALGPVDEKQAAGVFGELRTGSIQLEYLARAWPNSQQKISLTKWVRDSELRQEQPIIMLRGHQQYRRLDGFLTSLVCSLLIKEALSLPDSYERRIWVILDEFGNLPRIDGIDALLTGVRSKGVRIVAAIQDIAQIEETYSRSFAQTFFNCFGTILAGLCSGSTARYLSDSFGKNKIDRLQHSKSRKKGARGLAGGTSISETQQIVIENALIDTDFSNLEPPNMNIPASFWLRISGWPIGRLSYPVRPLPNKYPSHIEPSWLKDSSYPQKSPDSDQDKELADLCLPDPVMPLVRQYRPFGSKADADTESPGREV